MQHVVLSRIIEEIKTKVETRFKTFLNFQSRIRKEALDKIISITKSFKAIRDIKKKFRPCTIERIMENWKVFNHYSKGDLGNRL